MQDYDRLKILLAIMLAIGLAGIASAPAIAATAEDDLRARIYHRSDDDFQKEACVWKPAQIRSAVQGRRVLEIFPADTIAAIEIQGDETIMPTALLLRFMIEGRFDDHKPPIAVRTAPAGRLWLKSGDCMSFYVLLDPVDRQIASVRTDLSAVAVPALPDKCRAFTPSISPGMTRAEVEKELNLDGGITVPFHYERYVVPGSACTAKLEVIKVNLSYKPAGMSDAVYLLGKWLPPAPSPGDTVMQVSPRYLEMPFSD